MIKKKSAAAPAIKKAAKATSKASPKPASTVAKPSGKMPVAGAAVQAASSKRPGNSTVKPIVKSSSKPAPQAGGSVKPAAAKSPAAKSLTAKSPAAKSPVDRTPSVKSAAARTATDGVSAGSLLDIGDRPRKPKLIRDSFTMPEAEYAALGEVKKACLKAGYEVKKSELLRVGVGLIRKMDIVLLKDILAALPPLKAGRPKKS